MPAGIDVDQRRGIGYGYGRENGSAYHLGERAVSPFINGVYGRLQSLPPGSFVADLGGGAGRFPAHAPKDRHWRVFGVDHDPAAIAQASGVILPGDRVVVGDITKLSELPLPEN